MDSKKSVKAVLAALAVTSLFTSVNTIYAADQSQDKAKDKNAENAVKGQANQDSLYNMVALLDGTKTKSTAMTTAPVATTAANVKADAPKEDATTDTQSVTNNQGFYVQQDTANGGTAGVYNSLTKDGLWVGGTSDDTGFHVDNAGNAKTTGTVDATDLKLDGKSFKDANLTPGTVKSGNGGLAIGGGLTTVKGDYAIAIGTNGAFVNGNYGTAIGAAAGAGKNAVAIGNGAGAVHDNATAVGQTAQATEDNATALGQSTGAYVKNSTALGYNAEVGFGGENSVALGANSQVVDGDIKDSDNGNGVVSVGASDKTYGTPFNRRIINVADGVNKFDAVNKQQLDVVDTKVTGLSDSAVQYDKTADGKDTDYNSITLKGKAWQGTDIKNVGDIILAGKTTYGQDLSYAKAGITPGYGSDLSKDGIVSLRGNATGMNAIAIGTDADASQLSSISIGARAHSAAEYGVALGEGTWIDPVDQKATVKGDKGSVALGAGSTVTKSDTQNGTIGVVSVGSGDKDSRYGATRKIINVTDGTIDKDSHDAVTGGQLYTEQEARKSADQVFTNAFAAYEAAGITAGTVNTNGYKTSSNIALGSGASITFSKGYGFNADGSLQQYGVGPWNAVAIGADSRIVDSANAVVIGGGPLGGTSKIENSKSGVIIGNHNTIENSGAGVVIGSNSSLHNAANSVALGSQSIATEAGVVSVGRKAGDPDSDGDPAGTTITRRIVNVADGKDANDAATYGQLTTLQNKVNGLATPGLTTGSLDDASNGSVALGKESKITGASNSIAIGRATIDQSGIKNEGGTGEGPWNAIAIGGDNTSVKNSANGIALGAYAEVSNSKWGTALGSGTTVRDSEESLAVGHNAKVINAYKSTAVGYGAAALDTAFQSAAFGPSATVKGFNTVALGSQSFASGENSVALGSDSVAAEGKVISVGHKKGDIDRNGFAYGDDLFRKVTNVAAGTSDHDAVTVGQFKGTNGNFLQAVDKFDWKYAADNSEKFNKLAAAVADGKFDSFLNSSTTFDVSRISALSLAADVPTSILKEQADTTATDKRNPETGSGSTNGWTSDKDGLTTTGKVTTGDLVVNGNATLNKDLTVNGATTLKDTTVKGNLTIGEGKDAINVGDSIRANQAAIEQNQKDIATLGTSVQNLGDEVDSVGAISAALAGLHPLDYGGKDSKFQISAALGSYDGTRAAALGGFYNANRDTLISFGVSTNLNGDARKTAANIGATFRVGQGNSKEIPDDVASLRDEVVSLKAENATYKDRMDEMEKQLQELLKASKKN